VLHVSILLGHLQATHLLEGPSIALLRPFPMDRYQHVVIFRSVFAASLCCSTVCASFAPICAGLLGERILSAVLLADHSGHAV
jgi:hypothetical protein